MIDRAKERRDVAYTTGSSNFFVFTPFRWWFGTVKSKSTGNADDENRRKNKRCMHDEKNLRNASRQDKFFLYNTERSYLDWRSSLFVEISRCWCNRKFFLCYLHQQTSVQNVESKKRTAHPCCISMLIRNFDKEHRSLTIRSMFNWFLWIKSWSWVTYAWCTVIWIIRCVTQTNQSFNLSKTIELIIDSDFVDFLRWMHASYSSCRFSDYMIIDQSNDDSFRFRL